jgi:phosphoglucosamine mutase
MNRLFGTSGIRGSTTGTITERLALRLGFSVARMLGNRGRVIVGRDARTSSDALKRALTSGLISGGIDVWDLGLSPAPCVAFATQFIQADCGIEVTGSHNPPCDNGFKFYRRTGAEFGPVEEGKLEELVFVTEARTVDWSKLGTIREAGYLKNNYLERVLESFKPVDRRLHVVIDTANGPASCFTPLILSRLGCKVTSLNAQIDGYFPGRPPEPTPENLEETSRFVEAVNADIGIAHDGDADRLAVIDSQGRYIANDTILALFARLLLREYGPGRIVTSVDTSNRIDEVSKPLGGIVIRTKLGKTHLHVQGKDTTDIRLCCEPWKIIDPRWGPWQDSIHAAVQLVQALDECQGELSKLLVEIPDYPQERFGVKCPPGLKEKVVANVGEALAYEGNLEELWDYDGFRANYRDGSWLLIRASGTEDKIRIYCEARDKTRLKQLVEHGSRLVCEAISKAR